jgi:hypothetical protein
VAVLTHPDGALAHTHSPLPMRAVLALFVGEAEGRVRVCVPLDDNLRPDRYAPLTAYLLDRAGLT